MSQGNESHKLLGLNHRLIAPLGTAVVVLAEIMVGLSDLRRPLFYAASAGAGALLLTMTAWNFVARRILSALVAVAGLVLVGTVAWFGAPQTTPSPNASGVSRPTQLSPTSPSDSGEVVQEQPSEARAIFSPAIEAVTPWYNEILQMFGPATVENPEAEAALTGAWWALADWCDMKKHGSVGRCYDLGALYVRETFERDPRTINPTTWMNTGAIGSVLVGGYETTAHYLEFENPTPMIPDLVRNRPGIDWDCEPSCTAGWSLR